ncbi:4-hydroxythreonine-4-phosphate dehydrogenase PdxA [Rhizobium sp. XQZ8]|uniref:4-hydroxythreonine-4-phosphate dehydrogenase PdxA n=1 Tax=Rhizobium populisoli TaxID=2859785 RepID=UPI001CA46F4F|nr:4-hydroxythreonine-4-phosphate dehydrogenase PdxA [Rhizobium populisoli]MBW6424810.1 4-hydroxythreonine-4-phosphate dehydrogenase PdxA [Rhizobium populisoli]
MTYQTNKELRRPLLALAMGDPAGISPELAARLTVSERVASKARLAIIGDRRILEEGAKVAGLPLDIETVNADAIGSSEKPVLIDLGNLGAQDLSHGEATLAGGRFAVENFMLALTLAKQGKVDGVCYTPFNKKAMRLAHPGYDDESRFIVELLQLQRRVREFNVLDTVWNARVTSHIPLKDVAASLSIDAIRDEIALTADCLRRSGIEHPRILVAALNPHAGDGGSFGMEEVDIIGPAIEAAAADGFDVSGPHSADTVFVTALRGKYHAVLTMYHDQGQIAMKLMGFERGVTMLGGLPFPVCTPAHGTAYDIAGKGLANSLASEEAVMLAARMVSTADRRGDEHSD